jgi:hypothetical protein
MGSLKYEIGNTKLEIRSWRFRVDGMDRLMEKPNP